MRYALPRPTTLLPHTTSLAGYKCTTCKIAFFAAKDTDRGTFRIVKGSAASGSVDFRELGVPFWVPVIRIVVFWGVYIRVPLFLESTI